MKFNFSIGFEITIDTLQSIKNLFIIIVIGIKYL